MVPRASGPCPPGRLPAPGPSSRGCARPRAVGAAGVWGADDGGTGLVALRQGPPAPATRSLRLRCHTLGLSDGSGHNPLPVPALGHPSSCLTHLQRHLSRREDDRLCGDPRAGGKGGRAGPARGSCRCAAAARSGEGALEPPVKPSRFTAHRPVLRGRAGPGASTWLADGGGGKGRPRGLSDPAPPHCTQRQASDPSPGLSGGSPGPAPAVWGAGLVGTAWGWAQQVPALCPPQALGLTCLGEVRGRRQLGRASAV